MRYIVFLILNILILGAPLKGQGSGIGIIPLTRVGMISCDTLDQASNGATTPDSLRAAPPKPASCTVIVMQNEKERRLWTILLTAFHPPQRKVSTDPLVKLTHFILVKTIHYEYRKR